MPHSSVSEKGPRMVESGMPRMGGWEWWRLEPLVLVGNGKPPPNQPTNSTGRLVISLYLEKQQMRETETKRQRGRGEGGGEEERQRQIGRGRQKTKRPGSTCPAEVANLAKERTTPPPAPPPTPFARCLLGPRHPEAPDGGSSPRRTCAQHGKPPNSLRSARIGIRGVSGGTS